MRSQIKECEMWILRRFKWIVSILNQALMKMFESLILFYRSYLSPLKPPSCRYYPTCSSYSLTLFKTTHPLYALFFSIIRILKCHPLTKGGYDYPLVKVRISKLEHCVMDCSFWIIPKETMKPIFNLNQPIYFWAYILLKD